MPNKPLTPDANQLLVTLLAGVDALHLPIVRDSRHPAWSHVWIARRQYPASGLDWANKANSPAEARRRERALDALVEHGLVERFKLRGIAQRTSNTLLTREGVQLAGTFIGDDREASALLVAHEVRRQSLKLSGNPFAYVGEIEFNDGRGWGDGYERELLVVEEAHLAALVAGYVTAMPSTIHHVAYGLTQAGQAALEAFGDEPPYIEPPAADAALTAVYFAERKRCIGEWLGKTERISELGAIPLAATCSMFYTGSPNSVRREATA